MRFNAGDELGELLQRITRVEGGEGFGDLGEQAVVKGVRGHVKPIVSPAAPAAVSTDIAGILYIGKQSCLEIRSRIRNNSTSSIENHNILE